MLLMDVKSTFNHVSRNYLLRTMETMDADGDLILWIEAFMSNRSVSLVIEGHLFEETAVETGVLQGSPV